MQKLAEWMVGLAKTPVGPAGLFGLAMAEAVVFPLPPDLLLLALCVLDPGNSFLYAGICLAGSTLGGMLGYALGRWGGRPALERFVSQEKIRGVERQFQRYDVWAVFLAGFTPIPYKIFTIASGVFRIRFGRFVAASIGSRGARFFLVGGTVFVFRDHARRIVEQYFELFTIAFAVLLVGGVVVLRWLGGRQEQAERAPLESSEGTVDPRERRAPDDTPVPPLVMALRKAIPMEVRVAPDSGTYLEGVLKREDLPRCVALLREALGPPAKEFDEAKRFERETQRLVESIGGIRKDQCLFLGANGNPYTAYAALWPWASDSDRITLKIGIFVS